MRERPLLKGPRAISLASAAFRTFLGGPSALPPPVPPRLHCHLHFSVHFFLYSHKKKGLRCTQTGDISCNIMTGGKGSSWEWR